ncbi:hypothetical protein SBH91_000171, partial [Pseudomonas putida]
VSAFVLIVITGRFLRCRVMGCAGGPIRTMGIVISLLFAGRPRLRGVLLPVALFLHLALLSFAFEQGKPKHGQSSCQVHFSR